MRPQPADGFEWIERAEGPALRCRALAPFADHFFTTRAWRLGSAIADEAVAAGWEEVARAADVAPADLRRVRQVHGADVSVQSREPAGSCRDEADILLGGDPGMALAIQTADCVPILLADRRTACVAAAHAGWRGLAAGVPAVAVGALFDYCCSCTDELIAAIGPSISAARYEVGRDVRERFEAASFDRDRIAAWFPTETRAGHWLFDGWACARDQLEAAGVPATQIHVARLCTATYSDLFCSYRRDGARAGRMAAVIKSQV
jgi:YfiH family protein